MRTTVRLNDDLLRKAKRIAASTDRTLAAVIEDALRTALTDSPAGAPRRRVHLPTVRGHGVQPGVDLTSNAALFDLMERHDAAR